LSTSCDCVMPRLQLECLPGNGDHPHAKQHDEEPVRPANQLAQSCECWPCSSRRAGRSSRRRPRGRRAGVQGGACHSVSMRSCDGGRDRRTGDVRAPPHLSCTSSGSLRRCLAQNWRSAQRGRGNNLQVVSRPCGPDVPCGSGAARYPPGGTTTTRDRSTLAVHSYSSPSTA